MSRPSRRTLTRTANFIIVLLVAIGVGFVVFGSLTGSPLLRRNVAVPDLRGVPTDDAMRILTDSRLRGRVADAVPDTSIAAGRVTSQEPAAGTRARRDAMVNLTVSAGSIYANVPDVAGLSVEKARDAIHRAGLVPGRVDTVSDSMAFAMVIGTSPAAGATARRASTVAIRVSAGQPNIAVPELDGLTLAEATERIENAGLVVGLVRRTDQGRPGVIQGQRPAPGATVTRGAKVEIIISEERP